MCPIVESAQTSARARYCGRAAKFPVWYSITYMYGIEAEREQNFLFDSGTAPIFNLEELSFPLEVNSTTTMQLCLGIPQYTGVEKGSRAFSAVAEIAILWTSTFSNNNFKTSRYYTATTGQNVLNSTPPPVCGILDACFFELLFHNNLTCIILDFSSSFLKLR